VQAFALPAGQHHREDLSHRRADCSRTRDE
jgi:hypothetical protein